MYGHPILVHITAVILTIPTLFKHTALAAKAEVIEFQDDLAHAVATKKAIIQTF